MSVPAASDEDADLARRVYEACHLVGTFTLRSGRTATEYFDKYRFEADPVLLADIAAAMVALLPAGTEVLAGLELGGVPIATALSLRTGLPAAFVRKHAKAYGTARLAEGADIAGRRVTVIEDVITTGGQVLISAGELRALGAVVEHVVCVIDRSADDGAALAAEGLALTSLVTRADLDAANARRPPPSDLDV
jgi:orotate phosphoribosyltransferase